MSTIIWDGRTLAADKGAWSGDIIRTATKIFRIADPAGEEYLVGFVGDEAYATKILAWLKSGKAEDRPVPSEWYDRDDLNRQCALIIRKSDRRVVQLPKNLVWCPVEEKQFAIGGGQEIAYGALDAGADAVQALEIVSRRSNYAARGANYLTFGD